MTQLDRLEISAAQDLWDWLAAHHVQQTSVWLVTWKKATPEKYVSREKVLDALIAHGWIDGRRMVHDDPRKTMQLIGPRQQDIWAKTYQKRAAHLQTEGLMHPAGDAAITRAKAAGTWNAWSDVDALDIPSELETALAAAPSAAQWFETAAPSYKRNVLRYLRSAKQPETRTKRAVHIVSYAAKGKKLPNY